MNLTYITGNAGKIKEFKGLNSNGLLKNVIFLDVSLVEIQGTAEEIAIAKCKSAFEIVKGPVLIEDSSLYFDNLNGLPGPYIKDFMKKLDLVSLARLGNGTTAQAKCIYAYLDNSLTEPLLFVGEQYGKIVQPRSKTSNSFGWDPIFEVWIAETYAEMKIDKKNLYSDRALAFKKLSEYFKEKLNLENCKIILNNNQY